MDLEHCLLNFYRDLEVVSQSRARDLSPAVMWSAGSQRSLLGIWDHHSRWCSSLMWDLLSRFMVTVFLITTFREISERLSTFKGLLLFILYAPVFELMKRRGCSSNKGFLLLTLFLHCQPRDRVTQ